MNWVKYEKNNCEMPDMSLNDPTTDTVWIRTNNPYADRYGIGHYDYEDDSWWYYGCHDGFLVTHWAKIEPPQGERY